MKFTLSKWVFGVGALLALALAGGAGFKWGAFYKIVLDLADLF